MGPVKNVMLLLQGATVVVQCCIFVNSGAVSKLKHAVFEYQHSFITCRRIMGFFGLLCH
jgi:hypothetical protein